MNKATKVALLNLNNSPFYALFHSAPVFDSRLRTQWESGWHELKECFRNLIDGLQRFYGPGLNKGAHGWAHKKGFQLYEEEEYEVEVETIFRYALGCNAGFYFWSLINDESPRNSSRYYYYYSNKSYYFYNNYYGNYYENNNNDDNNNNNDYKKNRSSRKRRRRFEDDEDDDKDEDKDEDEDDKSARVETDFKKERIALGLSGSGPLSLEDVKNAYRACALKWHPDRHNGSFKAIAEAKFKICNAAYQSLCDKLGPK